jgi:hypothetical protein
MKSYVVKPSHKPQLTDFTFAKTNLTWNLVYNFTISTHDLPHTALDGITTPLLE